MKLLYVVLSFVVSITLIGESAPNPVDTSRFPDNRLYGLVQYNLIGQLNFRTDDSDAKLRQFKYGGRIGYYAGLASKIHEHLSLQFQIGNDWLITETITYRTNNNWNYSAKGLAPYFHLAFGTWEHERFKLLFGKIPVTSYGPLDLLERSIATNTYGSGGPGFGAAFLGWITGTNNNLLGMKLQLPLPVLSSGFSMDITYAFIDGDTSLNTARGQMFAEDPKSNPSEQLFIADFPLLKGNISFIPQLYTVVNRNYNTNTETGDNEIGAGFTVKYSGSGYSLRLRTGFATFNNRNTRKDFPLSGSEIVTLEERVQFGVMGGVGGTARLGPGVASVYAGMSTDEDAEVDKSRIYYFYINTSYIWSPVRNLSIIPRVRTFITHPGQSEAMPLQYFWPELVMMAKY